MHPPHDSDDCDVADCPDCEAIRVETQDYNRDMAEAEAEYIPTDKDWKDFEEAFPDEPDHDDGWDDDDF